MQNQLNNSEHGSFETTDLQDISNSRKFTNFCRNPQNHLTQFCKKTKIYGFNYLSDSKILGIGKLYWSLFICIGFYFSVSIIVHTWSSWNQSSVTLFMKNPKPIWEIPFPAVTICSETKIRQSIYNFTDYYHKMGESNMTSEELQTFSDASLFCDNHLYRSGNETTNIEAVTQYITKVSPSLRDVLFSCKWSSSTNLSCDNLFTPILTEDGLCFTFNMLNKNEIFSDKAKVHDNYMNHEIQSEGWTPENGYVKHGGNNAFPRRALTAGTKGGLLVLLASYDHDIDYVCRGPVPGFRISLHQPTEIPRIGTQYFRAPLKQELIVTVKPNLLTTATSLKNHSPPERGCYFKHERHLKFFRNYDKENCRVECLANFTLASCGCVAFYMLREETTEICGSGKTFCMFEAEQQLLIKNAESNVCNCLPTCTSLTYNVETSQADFNFDKVVKAFKTNLNDFPGIQLTRLTIFFKDMEFDTSERNKIHSSSTEFLAICGGILALFCGFSFLSIAEIIYFICIQTTINIKKYLR